MKVNDQNEGFKVNDKNGELKDNYKNGEDDTKDDFKKRVEDNDSDEDAAASNME